MIHLFLFYQFARFSLVLFGGGYMIIPFLMHTFVTENTVFSLTEFGNLLSISQITPGPVSLNAATYVGYVTGGVKGVFSACLGLVAPTLVLSFLAITFIRKWEGTSFMDGILKGTRFVSVAMIVYAALIFAGMSVFTEPINWTNIGHYIESFDLRALGGFRVNLIELLIAMAVCYGVLRTNIPVTLLIVASGLGCVLLHYFVKIIS